MEYNEPIGKRSAKNAESTANVQTGGLSWWKIQQIARPEGINRSLKAGGGSGNYPLVLVTPKSTNTQSKSMKGTSVDTKTMETQQQSILPTFQTSTSSLEDSLAKHLALLESELDLTTPEGHSFLTSHGFSKTKDPDIWYSKTSKVYLVTTRAKLSRQYLGFSPTWGIESNGRYLTAKTSEFPKTESASTLSDILEENVDEKYFLSDKAIKHLLSIADKKLGYSAERSIVTITKDTTESGL